jgi:hypothetical protein
MAASGEVCRMRSILVVCSLLAAVVAGPAFGNSFVKPMGKIILYQPSDTQAGGDLPTLSRGEEFGVNCGCMDSSMDATHTRVVLNLSTEPGQAPTGYKKLLATDQRIENGALRVRVPNTPGLANHTVDIEVYVVERSGAHACNAGKVKIT